MIVAYLIGFDSVWLPDRAAAKSVTTFGRQDRVELARRMSRGAPGKQRVFLRLCSMR